MAAKLPEWCKSAKIAMIEQDLTVNMVAAETGMSRPYISNIINGRVYSEKAVKVISDFLHIPDAGGSNFAFPSSE